MSYLGVANPLSWLSSQRQAVQKQDDLASVTVTVTDDCDAGDDGDSSDDIDEDVGEEEAPQFPARNSAQRQNKASSLQTPMTTTDRPAYKPRKKVGLAPGYSALDWAKLKNSGTDLRVSSKVSCHIC